MSAYLIYDVEIHDPGPYGKFMEQVKPLVETFGGRYLARGGPYEVLEGKWEPTRIVLFEFSRHGHCPKAVCQRRICSIEATAPKLLERKRCDCPGALT